MFKEKNAVKYFSVDKNKSIVKDSQENVRVRQSEEDLSNMNNTLYECYSKNKIVTISYFENGSYHHYSGVIAKIDVLNSQIILLPKKKFNLQDINKITAKN